MGIPGVLPGAQGNVEDFLNQSRAGNAGPLPHEFADFERIYQGAAPGRPMGQGPAGPMAGLPGLTPSLHVRQLSPVQHNKRCHASLVQHEERRYVYVGIYNLSVSEQCYFPHSCAACPAHRIFMCRLHEDL